jgi:hypothetical protein
LWLSYQLPPIQFPLKGGACTLGAADGALRVVVLLPGAAISVVEDLVSVVERPTRRVSIAIATSPAMPATTERLLGGWPEFGRYACFIVVTLFGSALLVDSPDAIVSSMLIVV